jgi:predicted nucleic acid-binding protein
LKCVLDASAAIEIAFDRKQAHFFSEALTAASEVLAPELLLAEATNTVWKIHQFEKIEVGKCEQALEMTFSLIDTFVSHAALYQEALRLSKVHKRRAAYDMFYLALAQREGATLLTLDAQLKKDAKREGIGVA